ncbi:hypothetical protein [Caballeronia sp. ATUFL_F2_KS9A]|uniref:hypothetical protein n=1 Tax=Caballeronia sp. ATUFL_F2_KS9A TaxID=2921777 RepID=UPI002028BF87|nr:hypothetical protein [Caballeronia sp. ATUFL_F2_KS9A]
MTKHRDHAAIRVISRIRRDCEVELVCRMPGFVVLVAELTNVVRGQDTVGIDVRYAQLQTPESLAIQ